MITCDVQGVAYSDKPFHQDLSPDSAVPLNSTEHFNSFQLFVLVLQPGLLMF